MLPEHLSWTWQDTLHVVTIAGIVFLWLELRRERWRCSLWRETALGLLQIAKDQVIIETDDGEVRLEKRKPHEPYQCPGDGLCQDCESLAQRMSDMAPQDSR